MMPFFPSKILKPTWIISLAQCVLFVARCEF
jgi:hypothetical protein